jgi:hypothetical protein
MRLKRCFCLASVVLFFIGTSLAFAQAPNAPSTNATFDRASFVAELRGLQAALKEKNTPAEIAAFRDALPPNWIVATADRTYSVSSQPLRAQLTPSTRQKAVAWLNCLAEEIDNSSAVPSNQAGKARAQLDQILAQSQFAAVRAPTPWELFRQRVWAWIERMLERLFGGIGRHPIAGEFLFWIIVIAGVLCIAVWLFRYLVSRDRMDGLESGPSVVNTRTWQEWIHAARQAADRGDFREAVHAAYWAGIVRLEDTGVVAKDRSKTPREYLRSVSDPQPGELFSRPVYREPLAALTSRLEKVWYANRGASTGDYQESLRQLEALGCQLE